MPCGPPLIHELNPGPDLERLAAQAGGRAFTLWLDSALKGPETGGYSFLAVDPYRVLRSADGRSVWIDSDGERDAGSALAALSEALDLDACAAALANDAATGFPPYPFLGGAAGFFGYELAGELETVPRARIRDTAQPDLEVGLYDIVIGLDHETGLGWVCSTGAPHGGSERNERARSRMDSALRWLAGGEPPSEFALGEPAARAPAGRESLDPSPPLFPVEKWPGVGSSISAAGYRDMVRRGVELIRAGDVFQVNLSQRLEIDCPERSRTASDNGISDFELYLSLRNRTPAPFGAFFRGSGCSILSASPERFLRVRDHRVETRPIKGTRPRGQLGVDDARLAADLLASEKDRAENLMIVDLLRNDLSRVCAPGSIRTTQLFGLESYATVHHLVSVIEGTLGAGRTPLALLQACFPGGSVTGAPKIRAMEIIADLEPVERGPYCGSVGYLGFDGTMDLSIAIRTAVRHDDRITFHAGGAVVADSDPGAEYMESLDKAGGLAAAFPRSAVGR